MKPLDDWIDDYSSFGFFVFYKPGVDRIMSNWFISSVKGGPVVSKLYNRLSMFWEQNHFPQPNRLQRRITRILSKTFNTNHTTTRHWFNPMIIKLLKIHPYFVFHYMFERLVSTDSEVRSIWNNMIKVSADGPHLIQRYGMFSPPTESIIRQIEYNRVPLFKLTWNCQGRYSPDTLLYYLLEKSIE